jgi:hypothetical protein
MSPTVDRKRLKTKAAEELARAAAPAGSVKPEPDVFGDAGGQQGEARARYQFRTMADAWKAPQFIPQRIRGILPAQGLSLIYGDPGSLKSMFAIYCAVAVALGRNILTAEDGTGGVPVRPGRSLIIDADNGLARLEMRLQAFARGFGIDDFRDIPGLCYGPMEYNGVPITIDTPAGLDALRFAIDDTEPDVVLLDSYGVAMGAADMNKPEMQRHLGNLRRITESYKNVFWGIHHSNKNGGMLGTQYFLATADMPLELQRPDKLGDLIEMSLKKVRDGITSIPAATWWHEAAPAVDEFGYEVSLLRRAGFRADASAITGTTRRDDAAERAVLAVLCGYPGGLSQRALVASAHESINQKGGTKVGERQLQDRILPDMVRRKLLITQQGKQNARLYLPGPEAGEVKP